MVVYVIITHISCVTMVIQLRANFDILRTIIRLPYACIKLK